MLYLSVTMPDVRLLEYRISSWDREREREGRDRGRERERRARDRRRGEEERRGKERVTEGDDKC